MAERLARQYTRIIDQELCFKIIHCIDNKIILRYDLFGILRRDEFLICFHLNSAVEMFQHLFCRFCLILIHHRFTEDDLSLQVRHTHGIRIHQPDRANSCTRKIQCCRCT